MLSKALIARLIPINASNDDAALLLLMEDAEVDYLMRLITPVQSYEMIPVTSVMIDLSRSPHNLFALASRDATMKLSDVMNSWSEYDQAIGAQLIWRMMELEYDGSEEMSVICNKGTLSEGKKHLAKVITAAGKVQGLDLVCTLPAICSN